MLMDIANFLASEITFYTYLITKNKKLTLLNNISFLFVFHLFYRFTSTLDKGTRFLIYLPNYSISDVNALSIDNIISSPTISFKYSEEVVNELYENSLAILDVSLYPNLSSSQLKYLANSFISFKLLNIKFTQSTSFYFYGIIVESIITS